MPAALRLGALRGRLGWRAARGTALLGLGLGLLLGRADHHDHVAAVLLRARLDEAELVDVLGQALQQPEAQLGPRLLATAEHDRHLDLVARLEEPLDVALLGAVVVRVDLRAELDLLDDRVDLVLARFPGLHRGFVLELAEVHELGDRRPGHGGHLDQVEVGLLGQSQRVLDADDADLLAVGADQAHFGDPDALVDARLADVVLLLWVTCGDPVLRDTEKAPRHRGCTRSLGVSGMRRSGLRSVRDHERLGLRVATEDRPPDRVRTIRPGDLAIGAGGSRGLLLHVDHRASARSRTGPPVRSPPGYQPAPPRPVIVHRRWAAPSPRRPTTTPQTTADEQTDRRRRRRRTPTASRRGRWRTRRAARPRRCRASSTSRASRSPRRALRGTRRLSVSTVAVIVGAQSRPETMISTAKRHAGGQRDRRGHQGQAAEQPEDGEGAVPGAVDQAADERARAPEGQDPADEPRGVQGAQGGDDGHVGAAEDEGRAGGGEVDRGDRDVMKPRQAPGAGVGTAGARRPPRRLAARRSRIGQRPGRP